MNIWSKVNKAIIDDDLPLADAEKKKLEADQRKREAKKKADGTTDQAVYFEKSVDSLDGTWQFKNNFNIVEFLGLKTVSSKSSSGKLTITTQSAPPSTNTTTTTTTTAIPSPTRLNNVSSPFSKSRQFVDRQESGSSDDEDDEINFEDVQDQNDEQGVQNDHLNDQDDIRDMSKFGSMSAPSSPRVPSKVVSRGAAAPTLVVDRTSSERTSQQRDVSPPNSAPFLGSNTIVQKHLSMSASSVLENALNNNNNHESNYVGDTTTVMSSSIVVSASDTNDIPTQPALTKDEPVTKTLRKRHSSHGLSSGPPPPQFSPPPPRKSGRDWPLQNILSDVANLSGQVSEFVGKRRSRQLGINQQKQLTLMKGDVSDDSDDSDHDEPSLKSRKKEFREEQKLLLAKVKEQKKKNRTGVLEKRIKSGTIKIRNSFKKWNDRWAVLVEGQLIYFKSRSDVAKEACTGIINLKGCYIKERPTKKAGFCIKIFNVSQYSIYSRSDLKGKPFLSNLIPAKSDYCLIRLNDVEKGKAWLSALISATPDFVSNKTFASNLPNADESSSEGADDGEGSEEKEKPLSVNTNNSNKNNVVERESPTGTTATAGGGGGQIEDVQFEEAEAEDILSYSLDMEDGNYGYQRIENNISLHVRSIIKSYLKMGFAQQDAKLEDLSKAIQRKIDSELSRAEAKLNYTLRTKLLNASTSTTTGALNTTTTPSSTTSKQSPDSKSYNWINISLVFLLLLTIYQITCLTTLVERVAQPVSNSSL
eukprot:TRINITY_DN3889_c0_g1_i2.p1 TRINITY_DN3889_c0_g1~~TRINITY_DN3889_c0_g1_i2.p1  ORF type:complete len:758 (-),score=234.54 TRINITY_DN3889_c0_g1_i2:2121-4394(-)